ncbi:MAG TPA: DUF2752 domain-containing protein [Pirellulales bacterium]|nr:DUF2752 domain-containing protein [Pirellulales bacterium]
MIEDRSSLAGRLSRPQRCLVLVTGVVLVLMIATAAWLEPSPQGYGTHRQLGLPECASLRWFGVRCPACGMTTSWTWLAHGSVAAALAANVGGALLGVAALLAASWLLASAARGAWVVGRPKAWFVVAAAGAWLATTMVDWLVRIASP